jgi:pyruvoyl-dependent arginine decarboxylase (PvlArgDC)
MSFFQSKFNFVCATSIIPKLDSWVSKTGCWVRNAGAPISVLWLEGHNQTKQLGIGYDGFVAGPSGLPLRI